MTEAGNLRLIEPPQEIAMGRSATRAPTMPAREIALLLSSFPSVLEVPSEERTFIGQAGLEEIPLWQVTIESSLALGVPGFWRFLGAYLEIVPVSGVHWDIEILNSRVFTWGSSAHVGTEDESVAEATVQSFSVIEEVAAIYIDKALDGTTVWIFVEGDEYDDALMDRLLDEEVSLLSRFPDQDVSFMYIPAAGRSHYRDVISSAATLIYRKSPHG